MQRIFVGDVQGCHTELAQILARADQRFGPEAELWFVGDLINRGPGDLQVLEAVRRRVEDGRARVVLGNHELNFLRLAWGQRELRPGDTLDRLVSRADAREWIDWIRKLPVIAGGTLGERPFVMLHAASAPQWTARQLAKRARRAERQLGHEDEKVARRFAAATTGGDPELAAVRDDLGRILTCRSVRGDAWASELPSEMGRGAVPWHRPWRARKHAHALVYGHWSMQGLHVEDSIRGLDTGCVHRLPGARLTAWLPDEDLEDPFAARQDHLWEIPAERA